MTPEPLTCGLGIYSSCKKQLGMEHKPRNRDRRGLVIGGAGLLLIGILNGSLASGTGLFVTLWWCAGSAWITS